MKIREWWMVTMHLITTTIGAFWFFFKHQQRPLRFLLLLENIMNNEDSLPNQPDYFFWMRWLLRSWIFRVDFLGSMVTLVCLRQSTRRVPFMSWLDTPFFVSGLNAWIAVFGVGHEEYLTWHRTWGPYPPGLPLTSLCDLPLLFVYFQVNNGVLYYLDYVEDIYVLVSMLNPNHIVFTTTSDKLYGTPIPVQQ